jgi:ribosomal-protein-alanine N-acetyltransferase
MIPQREYFVRTKRLGVSQWRAEDLPLALQLWGDPRVTRWIGGPWTADEIAGRLRQETERRDFSFGRQLQYWPIFILADHQFAGCTGLRPYNQPGMRSLNPSFEIGFHLCPQYWGRGIAEEAGHAVIQLAFGTFGAVALFAGHHPQNQASKRVIERLGFGLVGEEFYAPTGLDHPTYMLLKPGRVQGLKTD